MQLSNVGPDQLPVRPLLHTLKNAARLLGGLSQATMYRMIKQGQLEAIKVTDRTLVTDKSIARLIETAPRLQVR